MSLEIESRILGMLILIGDAKDVRSQEIMLKIDSYLFYDRDARKLFDTIYKLYSNNALFDSGRLLSQVDPELFDYLTHVLTGAWNSSTIDSDIQYLIDYDRSQQIKIMLKNLSHQVDMETMPDISCDIATQGCIAIGNLGVVKSDHVFSSERNADNFMNGNLVNNKTISTGIKTLDDLLDGGIKESCMLTIAGRSGMGKTGFGVYMAHNLARNHPHQHVLFYSLEMSAADIYEKQLACILGRHPVLLDHETKRRITTEANKTKFTIFEETLASISYIETTSRIMAIKNPLSVIVVDYLSIVQNDSKFESNALKQADIAMRLASLAKELNCIVIALTQVNRDHAGRQDKSPVTSDAADSSGSERSSTYWFGIYRPKVDDDNEPDDFIVKCRKNRFGKTWSAKFAFDNALFREVEQIMTCYLTKQKKGYQDYKNSQDLDL